VFVSNKIKKILGEHLRRKRKELKYKIRDVARETNIAPSTLSLIEREKRMPHSEVIARLCSWLGIPVDRVLQIDSEAVVYNPGEPLPDIIAAHLKQDKNLSPVAAEKLAMIFRTAYEQFKDFSKK